ncbi:MAG TPA: hypothetical protein VGO46_02595 [Gemmatimonadaceae bacterium]|nr:hypothetical protein [Gemmatimonadaceae bacterium]
MTAPRIFLLSPAFCGGERAKLLFNPDAAFPLATRLRAGGVPIGELFAFLSGLYFRGKLAYARAFARAPSDASGLLVITPTRGLLDPDTLLTLDDMREFAEVNIATQSERFIEPLARDAHALAATTGSAPAILLGSIATDKYVGTLTAAFGERLAFPEQFIGRGDMSRGGLLLRSVRESTELDYIAVSGATRRGARPPKLVPIR